MSSKRSHSPLLLFDLDGTLLLSSGAGARAMELAGKQVWGDSFSMASIDFAGSLDPVILSEATHQAGVELNFESHGRFRRCYDEQLRVELARPETRAYALPGVLSLLKQLMASKLATLGLLTGNYEETGCQKLSAVGINPNWFSPRVWGDEGPTRPDLVRVAMQRQAHHEPSSVVVVGDTTRDVHCAKVNGCRVVGVATGSCSIRQLLDAGADLAVPDLSDPSPLLALLA
jgi:phosphoglycolate phosphatase-like HAD superfamily hydrolase